MAIQKIDEYMHTLLHLVADIHEVIKKMDTLVDEMVLKQGETNGDL